SEALRGSREDCCAQIPVYENKKLSQRGTTNPISRRVAIDLADKYSRGARTIGDVLAMVEKVDQAVFLARDITAQQAVDALITPDKKGRLPYAAIVTETGSRDGQPLRIITASDLAVLIEV